jgi:hypothetical protein
MHTSIATYTGNPDELLRSYDAMLAEVPTEIMRLHLCARADDGIVVVDTCPSREAYEAFMASDVRREMCARHGLPDPTTIEDFPVHVAFSDGRRVEEEIHHGQ